MICDNVLNFEFVFFNNNMMNIFDHLKYITYNLENLRKLRPHERYAIKQEILAKYLNGTKLRFFAKHIHLEESDIVLFIYFGIGLYFNEVGLTRCRNVDRVLPLLMSVKILHLDGTDVSNVDMLGYLEELDLYRTKLDIPDLTHLNSVPYIIIGNVQTLKVIRYGKLDA